jgi:uncharacterized membrane protein YeaQ/YmgE (transglycosylase-associated protein family)
MDIQSLILFLLVGLVAGWLASQIMGGRFGLSGDLLLGVLGAFVGGFLFRALGIFGGTGLLGALVVALCGSVVLLFLLRLIQRPAKA